MALVGGPEPKKLPPPDIVLIYEGAKDHEGRPSQCSQQLLKCPVSGRNSLGSQSADSQRRGSNVSIVSVKGKGFKSTSREYRCWKCNKSIYTMPKQALTPLGWTLSVMSCILCPLFAICLIPAVMKSQHIVIHKCPLCRSRLGSSAC